MVVLREPSTTVRLTPNRIAQWRRETHDKYAQDYHHRWLCDPSAQATRNRFRQSLDPVTLRPAINTTLRWNLRRDFIGHSRKQREDEEALWYWHAKHHPPRAYMPIVLGDGPISLPLSLREAPLDSPTSGCTLFPPSGVSETNGHLRDLYGTVPPVDFLRINRYLQGRTANMTALQKRQYTEKKVQEQVQRAAYVRRLQQQEIVSEHDVHQRFDDSASNVSARSYQRRKIPPQFSSALQSDAGSAALERRLELINRRRKPIPLDVDWTQYHMSDGTDTFSDGAERSLKCTANEEEFAKRQHRAGMRAQSREVGTAVSAPRHTRRMQLGKCAALHARNTEKQTDRANDTSHVKSTSRFHANIASSIHHARTVAKENQRDNNVSPPLEPLDLKSPSRNAPESALTEQCKTDEAGVRQNPGKHQPEGHGATKSMVSEGLNDHRVAIPPANSKTSILKNRARCARPQSCAPRIVSYPQK